MKKIILAALTVAIFVCGTLSATAQTRHTSDANIYGHIIDSKTKEHIPYVTISIKGTTYGTVADASGHYFLKNLPEGKHTVVAESLTHKSAEQEVTLTKGKNIEVNFTLLENTL
ncbi:MAG: carboxypeptidase-like regulatory domain-containing protein, partial [Alistipes sp.]|nr:carboxypeptidase-like regulatory domain-containing protein [Alistipes sp.]